MLFRSNGGGVGRGGCGFGGSEVEEEEGAEEERAEARARRRATIVAFVDTLPVRKVSKGEFRFFPYSNLR